MEIQILTPSKIKTENGPNRLVIFELVISYLKVMGYVAIYVYGCH